MPGPLDVGTEVSERRVENPVGAVARLLGARGYEQSRIQRYIARVHDAMLDSLAAGVSSPPRTILDVGCGTGRLLRRLGERWPGSGLFGVDPDPGMISVAKEENHSATYRVALAESLLLADASIDVAVSSISFHHWRDPLQGLREIARVLRPGGLFCLADITMHRWCARMIRSGARSPDAIRSLIAQADLDLQEQRVVLARLIVVAVAIKRPVV